MIWGWLAWLINHRHFSKIVTEIACIQPMLNVWFEWSTNFLFGQFYPIYAFEEAMSLYFVWSPWAGTYGKSFIYIHKKN